MAHVLPSRHILVDRYFVGLVLGEGGYAITYRAVDTDTNKKVAIKELFPDGIVDRNRGTDVLPKDLRGREAEYFNKAKDDFAREIEYVKTISHPHIAKYVNDFKDNYTIYLVTEYEEGSTLKEYVSVFGKVESHGEYKRIPFPKAVQLLLPITEALSYVHSSRNAVHRDVSPDNIFVRDVHGATLIDFGSTRRVGEGSRLQKAGFTPPEIVEGRDTEQTAASDVYSLAATLYWCCTGDFAWSVPDGDTAPQFLSLQSKGVQCSDPANAAVTKALARDPKERFPSVADFAKELDPEERRDPPAPLPPPRLPRPNRSTLWKVIISEIVIIAVVLIGFGWLYIAGSRGCTVGCSFLERIGYGMVDLRLRTNIITREAGNDVSN